MYPFIHIFDKTIPTYGLLGTLGVLLGWLYVWIRCKRKNKELETDCVILYMYGFIGALIGAKFFSLLQNLPVVLRSFTLGWDGFVEFWTVNFRGGMVFYGGLIGALILILLYARHYKVSLTPHLNILVPALPLAHGFGRIGCYLAGCCYGNIGVFPVQLVEAVFNFLLCIVLSTISVKIKNGRYILAAYLISYGIGRFILEFFREDTIRGFLGPLSTSQIISVFAVGIGIVLFIKNNYSTQTRGLNK